MDIETGFSRILETKIVRTKYRIGTYRYLNAKTLKEWINKIPDDAVLLGREDNADYIANHELIFQNESETKQML
jgi:hypothetical protein